ncbi:MAG: tRNA 2-thiouridine(34) synthase MnmA [Flavobacteriia bacterium]|jgi:tRNA-specific 2-thiouridylase|nr:tRNA 2-thiouridine(34) synthase MnmA [Flavobacteriia bacterium]
MKRVVVGLSGGVDSSVAALLLQQQGYEVIGMFMRNWHDQSVTLSDECPWIDDSNDALLIAQQLGIPFQVIDLSEEYKERIVNYMFAEYQAGRTPNPDVLCNREIKFDVFLKAALELGADYVATGHYCQKRTNEDGSFSLLAGADPGKDQSYFLCQLSQEQLSKALFPIGQLQKAEVRQIAQENGLITADKKDSQGLCFVGKIALPTFLQQQLAPKIGPVIEVPSDLDQFKAYQTLQPIASNIELLSKPFHFELTDGKEVTTHQGAHYYTIGQRKGLHIGGRPEPSFVIGIDTIHNIVYSGQNEQHPGLNRWALKLDENSISWVNKVQEFELKQLLPCLVRIRYRQPLQKATLLKNDTGCYILFEHKQKGIAPGQFAAWYNGEELLGSGVIA